MIPDVSYEFRPWIAHNSDSLSNDLYSLYLLIRFTEKCRIRELPLDIEMTCNTEDSLIRKHIEVTLFNEEDKVKGEGNYGIYRTEVNFASECRLDENFYISVETSEKDTQGVVSLGVGWKKQE